MATTGGSPGPATSTVPSGSATGAPTALPEPAGPPALSTLAPASGQAGQTVTVTGSNFLSSSGQISAQIGGQVAPVACPNQTICTIVIPPNPGSTSAASVTVTTDSGTSNALVFTYGIARSTGHGPVGRQPVTGTPHGENKPTA